METPKTDHPIFRDIVNYIVANNTVVCRAAEKKAKELGYETQILTTTLTGEAKEVGKTLIQHIRSKNIKEKNKTYIAGGETTVTLKGNGRGGRNQEIVLGALQELDRKKFVFASFSTDGIDGNSDAAGAIADGYTLKRAREKKLDQYLFLKENNSYEFFKKLNDLLITGSTGTNVMDIQIILH